MTEQLFDLPQEPQRQGYEDYDAPERAPVRRQREFLGGPEDRFREAARARTTDPAESHAAAASVTGITAKQDALLACLRSAEKPLSDIEIGERYEAHQTASAWPQQSESGLRTRRSELVKLGYIEKAGTTKLPSGRTAAIWRLT